MIYDKTEDDANEIFENIRRFAVTRPDSIAVIDDRGNRVFTYRDFIELTDDIASSLRDRGIIPGKVVSIRLGRIAEHMASRLACLCLGAVPFSIDPLIPEERAQLLIRASNTSFVIDRDFFPVEKRTASIEYPKLSDNAPGYLVFTSGSTGNPKGILHPRATFRFFIKMMKETGIVFTDRRLGSIASVSFNVSSFEFLFVFHECGTMVMIDDKLRSDIPSVREFIKRMNITLMVANPSYYRAVGADCGLKAVGLTGERTGRLKYDPNVDVYNFYGTSESVTSFSKLKADTDDMTIGDPMKGNRIELLDEEGNQADIGEIVYHGEGVMLGYLHEMTDGIPKEPATSYRSGDLGRRDPDGIRIIGRIGGMVKINGQRVEPAETEYTMSHIPGIVSAVVKSFSDSGTYLCGYYIGGPEPDDVRRILMSKLNSYMIPAFISKVESFPVNRNGKIDRQALQTLKPASGNRSAPENDIQRILCEAFSSVLGIKDVGPDDDFIALGGDSIRAMKMQSELPFRIDMTDIIGLRTPRKISETAGLQIEPKYSFEKGCPLNTSQTGVYLDIISGKDGTEYNNPFKAELGKADGKKLAEALETVIKAHPILRGRVVIDDDTPGMVFDSYPEISFGNELTVRPFDIHTGPLCRFVISEGETTVLYADIHHLIADGASMSVLLRDLKRAYGGEALSTDDGILRSCTFDEQKDIDMGIFNEMLNGNDNSSTLEFSDRECGVIRKMVDIDLDSAKRRISSFGVTLGSFLTSAFAYALSKMNGNDRAVFCIAENGRGKMDLSNSVGMYVRTLPIAVDCDCNDTGTFVKRCHSAVTAASSSDVVPFHELSKKFGVRSDIVFQYAYDLIPSELRIEPLEHDPVSQIGFSVSDAENGFMITAEYRDTESRYVQSLVSCTEHVLKGMLLMNELNEIPLITDDDCTELDSLHGPAKDLVNDNMIDAYLRTVRDRGNNTLVSFNGRAVTYSESLRIIGAIAHDLKKISIGRGDAVAVVVPRSEWYVLASLGVLASGAAYVPIDDANPDERIRMMIEDSDTKAAIISDITKERKIFGNIPLINVDHLENNGHGIDCIPDPDDTAVILFTSGTTGRPKGSQITHRALVNLSEWYVGYTEMNEYDRYGLYCSFTFDMHTLSIFPMLLCGASCEIIPEDVRLDVTALNDCFKKRSVTHTCITTNVAKLFGTVNRDSTVRFLLVIGEKLGNYHAPESFGMCESYGPSENLALSTYIPINERRYDNSVGRMLPNMEMYILDRDRRRLPYGATGELYLSGVHLSKGYINRGEENSKAFFDDPFSSGCDRMYATGDFARFLPDGTLGIIGRRDGQVKIRGNRVELTEVEDAIKSMKEVKNATVQAFDNGHGSKELYAYIVCSGTITADEIRDNISKTKPDYMVPTHIAFLDDIPLNINGKVNVKALPKDTESRTRTYEEPMNDAERNICKAFSEVLGIEKVGRNDDFIELGGDSLKVLRLMVAYKNIANDGTEIKPADVFDLRTAAKISQRIRHIDLKIIYNEDTGIPMTDSMVCAMHMHRSSYRSGLSFRYTIRNRRWGDRNKLINSIHTFFDLTPAVRMRYCDDSIARFDLKPIVNTAEGTAECGWEKELYQTDDLSMPAKVTVFDDASLFVQISHLYLDGRSLIGMIKKIDDIYAGKIMRYDDGIFALASYEHDIRNDMNYARSKEMLESLQKRASELPSIRNPSGEEPTLKTFIFDITRTDIDEAAKRYGRTITEYLTIMFGVAKARFTGTDSSSFSFVVNGRNISETSDTAGFLLRYRPVIIQNEETDMRTFIEHSAKDLDKVMVLDQCPLSDLSEFGFNDWDVHFQYEDYMDKEDPDIEITNMMPFRMINVLSFGVNLSSGNMHIWAYIGSDYSKDDASKLMSLFEDTLRKSFTAINSEDIWH